MEHPHPRLVRLLGYCNEGSNFCLVYEFMKGGSLQSLLENPEKLKKLTAKQRIQIAEDIASTINFLHSNGIFHLEIKPGNILLDENYRTFLADCGSAKLLLDGTTLKASYFSNSPCHVSPDMMFSVLGLFFFNF
eukprot:TRINITY_DN2230_c0_g1_i1.p1 TRINITY_DN2230_c0_g1~~TRINITY_DN2230_c0_g1_i1.p1  ORF type:complete len:153 (-),score=49.37 TRINITY_DN2230_c0_g1_i1:249-650(-)